ncbi:MAG: sigma-70 family RNA polymerase sigma factor [Sedimentibacter sp.]|uniref:sigma-70 family RNA polymerase sigma factor n=1 Tax=Sedimentibacter sp. TaxID=1960295 RepID=UPI0031594070
MNPVVLFNSLLCCSEDYEAFSDEELVDMSRFGDEYASENLCKRYTHVVKRITSSFFLIGGSKDDLFQEAMIGLVKAVKTYNRNLGTKFRSFAELCIRRQVITAIRKTELNKTAYKIIPLHDCADYENDSNVLDDNFDTNRLNPEFVYINGEELNQYMYMASKVLSSFEWKVLAEYRSGKSYAEISASLNKSIKSIDNAVQRIRKKICSNKENFIY